MALTLLVLRARACVYITKHLRPHVCLYKCLINSPCVPKCVRVRREWEDRNRALRNEKEIMSRHYAHLKSGMDSFRAMQVHTHTHMEHPGPPSMSHQISAHRDARPVRMLLCTRHVCGHVSALAGTAGRRHGWKPGCSMCVCVCLRVCLYLRVCLCVCASTGRASPCAYTRQ